MPDDRTPAPKPSEAAMILANRARGAAPNEEIARQIDALAALYRERIERLTDQLAQQSIDLGNAIDRANEAEEQIARLTALASESDLIWAGKLILYGPPNTIPAMNENTERVASAIAQARRQGELRATENNALANKHACVEGRRQMREEAAAKARLYAHSPCSGDSNNTQEAFDQGMNHLAGAIDSAIAIEAAIRALPLVPLGEEASGS